MACFSWYHIYIISSGSLLAVLSHSVHFFGNEGLSSSVFMLRQYQPLWRQHGKNRKAVLMPLPPCLVQHTHTHMQSARCCSTLTHTSTRNQRELCYFMQKVTWPPLIRGKAELKWQAHKARAVSCFTMTAAKSQHRVCACGAERKLP